MQFREQINSILQEIHKDVPGTLRQAGKRILEKASELDSIPLMLLAALISRVPNAFAWFLDEGSDLLSNKLDGAKEAVAQLKNTYEASKILHPETLNKDLKATIASFQEHEEFQARLLEQNDRYLFRSWVVDTPNQRTLIKITDSDRGLTISLNYGACSDSMGTNYEPELFKNHTYNILTLRADRLRPNLFTSITLSKSTCINWDESEPTTLNAASWKSNLQDALPVEISSHLSLFKPQH